MNKKLLKLITIPLLCICIFAIILSLSTGCSFRLRKDDAVTIWIMPNSQEPENDLKDVLFPFHEKNPEIKIEITPIDWGAAWVKITTAATSGQAPDIVQLGTTWIGSVSALNILTDLTEHAQEIDGANKFVKASWKTGVLVDTKKVMSIPWFVDARAMFYRTDVFDKLNISAKDIDTWEGFEKALVKIKKADLTINGIKVAPLGISGKNDWNVIHNIAPWIWMAGGGYLKTDLKKSNLDSPESINGLSFYVSLVKKGYIPLESLEKNTAQISSGFNNGYYAMYFDGPYQLKNLTTPPERGGSSNLPTAKNFAVPYPKGPKGRVTFIGGSSLAIFKTSKKKKQAWKVVKYLTTDRNAQISYAKATGYIPVYKESFDSAYFRKDNNRKVFIDAVAYGRSYPTISVWGILEPVLTRSLGIMWDNVIECTEKNLAIKPIITKALKESASEMNKELMNQERKKQNDTK
ncbi:sugar ABC transporter substrate-binding protein [Candidatus Margulisiibacteriota bacterium]